jgi:hypothetical protein
MAAAAILDFGWYFRFWHFSIRHVVMSLYFKFHQNPSIGSIVMAVFVCLAFTWEIPIRPKIWGVFGANGPQNL